MKKFLQAIEKSSGISFVYSPALIDSRRNVTVAADQKPLADVLNEVLLPLKIGFAVEGPNTIVLFPAKDAARTIDTLSDKKQIIVAGRITDVQGKPLEGASVIVSGTEKGTATDAEGRFQLPVASFEQYIQISIVGYRPWQEKATPAYMDIRLELKEVSLDEVVLVGYGEQKKISNVGAQSSIGTTEILQSPVANISNALVGRLPGLFAVQPSGEPGADQSSLRIRGIGTFAGNASPLVLVDGLQVDNFNNIAPAEIENITILKDAASTAVYGIRGNNGVMLITTKRGRAGKPTMTYTVNTAFNSFTQMRKMMNAADFAASFNRAEAADAYITGTTYTPRFSDEDIRKYASGEDPIFYPDVDWVKLMLKKTSLQQQHNLSLRGGTQQVHYFISAGYFNQEGLLKNTTGFEDFDAQLRYKRYNFRSNLNFFLTKRFRTAIDLSTQFENRTGSNSNINTLMNTLLSANPLGSPGIVDGKIITLNVSPPRGDNVSNPLTSLFTSGYKRDFRQYLNGSIRFDYDLDLVAKGLTTHATVGVQSFNRQYDIYFRNLITYLAQRQGGNTVYLQQADFQNFLYQSFDPNTARDMRSRRTTFEWALEYKRSFGGHAVNAMALYNQVKTDDPDFAFRVPNGYQSYVGRIVYNYQQRYLVEISGAYNGTENFAPGKRFGLFPSIAIGWVPSFEAFFPKNGFIGLLKLRASYGQVGNDQLSLNFLEDPLARFLFRPTAFSPTGPSSTDGYYFWGTVGSTYGLYPAIREGRLSNPDLTWERAVKTNVGLEMSLWKNRINLTVDAFHEERDNILTVPQTIPSLIGVQPAAQNIGRMTNRGFEATVTLRSHFQRLQYWVKGSYSFARNKIEYQDEIQQRYSYRQRTGQRFGQFFGLVSEGFYNSWDEVNDPLRPISTFVGNNRLQPGDIKYRDINSDGVLNEDDMVPLGYAAFPEIVYGVSVGGNLKGFDFSLLLQGASNVSTFYSRRANQAFYDDHRAAAPAYLSESWTPDRYAAGEAIRFPRFSIGSGASQTHNYQPSTLWVVKASYLRLKNAEVGYTFHAALLRRIGLSSARVYFNGNNLFTWSGLLPGIDPESPNLNNNREPYPLVRTVNVGLTIHF